MINNIHTIGSVEAEGLSDSVQQELAAILQTATQPVVIPIGDRKCMITLLPREECMDPVTDASIKEKTVNEIATLPEPPDFLLHDGAIYGRLAVSLVRQDFMSTAVPVEFAKKNYREECLEACMRRNLDRGTTIPNAVKYANAAEIGLPNLSEFSEFKPGQPAYRMINKYMSENGYSRKPKMWLK